MKYFQHDLSTRENPKIWKLVKTHGMIGYGIWWSLLEEIYKAEESGFQVQATELWMEQFADSLRLQDERVLVRIFDTFADVGLIDKQLWHEKVLYTSSVVERGQSYVKKKEDTKERVKRFREARKSRPVSEVKRVSNALQRQCNAGVTPNIDIELDVDLDLEKDLDTNYKQEREKPKEEDRSRDQSVRPSRKKKGLASGEIYDLLVDREGFESFWKWIVGQYAKVPPRKDGSRPNPGSKSEAALAFHEHIEKPGRREDLRRAAQVAAQVDAFSMIGLPHVCRWLKDGHWENILTQSAEPKGSNEFVGGDSGLNLSGVVAAIRGEQDRLRIKGAILQEWREKSGCDCLTVGELNLQEAQAYLQYLRGLNHAVSA